MRVLGYTVTVQDIVRGILRVDTWFDTVTTLLQGYQYGQRFFATMDTSIAHNIPNGAFTLVPYGQGTSVINYDTFPLLSRNGGFDPITARFTPTVSGYYQIHAGVAWGAAIDSCISIYKNGVELLRGPQTTANNVAVTSAVYLDADDYIDIRAYQASGASQVIAPNAGTYFNGYLARPA